MSGTAAAFAELTLCSVEVDRTAAAM